MWPQNGPPLLKAYCGNNDFEAHGFQGSRLAVLPLEPGRPQNGPKLLKVDYGNDDFAAYGLQERFKAILAFPWPVS